MTVFDHLEWCPLCGRKTKTYADLCDRCADAFQSLSDRLGRIRSSGPEPVRGQLSLVPDDDQ